MKVVKKVANGHGTIKNVILLLLNWLRSFKKITIDLILLNPTKIRTNLKIQKLLTGI